MIMHLAALQILIGNGLWLAFLSKPINLEADNGKSMVFMICSVLMLMLYLSEDIISILVL